MRYTPGQLAARRREKKALLSILGYRSYEPYLASKHWKRVKSSWKKAGRPECCEVCGSTQYHLHHWTYRYLGDEHNNLDCLQALCETHHKEYHHAENTGQDVALTLAGRAMTRRKLSDQLAPLHTSEPEPTREELQEKYRKTRTDRPDMMRTKRPGDNFRRDQHSRKKKSK